MVAHKTVCSAVIIQPPLEQWNQIQSIREKHDKAFVRWMPHINLYVKYSNSFILCSSMHVGYILFLKQEVMKWKK